MKVELTGELMAVGSFGTSVSVTGWEAAVASVVETLRRLFPGVVGTGLRMENPIVPKTLRETLRLLGLMADGGGGGSS